ncbi:hypothetical protein RUND412_009727 [Rhizina undulata]
MSPHLQSLREHVQKTSQIHSRPSPELLPEDLIQQIKAVKLLLEDKPEIIEELCITPEAEDLEDKYRRVLENLHMLEILYLDEEPFSYPPKTVSKILQWFLETLRPPAQLRPPNSYDDSTPVSPNPEALAIFRTLSSVALRLLSQLLLATSTVPSDLVPEITSTVVSYVFDDFWTSAESTTLAVKILEKHKSLLVTREIMVDYILKRIVKPLFAKSGAAHPEVTAEGRRAIRASTKKNFGIGHLGLEGPAWIAERAEAVALLKWVLVNIDTSDIEPNWHLLVPPILKTIDSPSAPAKASGCILIRTLLSRLEEFSMSSSPKTSLLNRTGLGPVFWDTLMPCLMYLPPLTPTSQSVPLLNAAYEAIILLARLRAGNQGREKAKFLDAVMREGVIRGIGFADEHVKAAEVIVTWIGPLVKEMGVWGVRYLKTILPIISDILANPFGTTYPPLLLAAVKPLQAVIEVCWIRCPPYKAEVMRGVAFCWRRILEDEDKGKREELENIKKELKTVVVMLHSICENAGGNDWEEWREMKEGLRDVDGRFVAFLE